MHAIPPRPDPSVGVGPNTLSAGLSSESAPLVRAISAGELYRLDQKRVAAETAAARDLQMRSTVLQGLSAHLRRLWEAARNERNTSNLETRLLKCLYTRKSEYTPEKLAAIQRFGGSDVFAGITATKIRALTAWLKDVLIDQPEKPWGLEATPVPELSPDVMAELTNVVAIELQAWIMQNGVIPQQEFVDMYYAVMLEEMQNRVTEEAKNRAANMEKLIEDQLAEGGFNQQFSLFLDDYCTFPAAIFKGPIPMRKRDLKWSMDASGQTVPVVTEKVKLVYKRVSPFDFYPSPTAENPQQGYLFERHRMSAADLYNYIGVKGYNEEAIRAVLDEGDVGGLSGWLDAPIDFQKAAAEDRSNLFTRGTRGEVIFDVLEFWGPVSGKLLSEWGVTVDDMQRTYEVSAWLVKDWVVFADVNPNPMGRRPYYKSSFDPIPGAFWGQSLVDILDDPQQIVNGCARATVNNMGFSSGPMVGLNKERMSPGQQVDQIVPWMTFQFQNDPMGGGAGGPPIEFFQPESNVGELMGLLDKMYSLADDLSGMPRYMQGQNSPASRTASGLSMLMNAASKSVKQLVANVDRDVLSQMIEENYTHNMLYHPDPSVKGDLCVIARGASAIVHKEAVQARRNEFLALTANPLDSQIMGPQGRAALLREAAKGLDIDPAQIVPPLTKERLLAANNAMAGVKGGGMPQPGQVLDDGMGTPVTDNMGPVAQDTPMGGMPQ